MTATTRHDAHLQPKHLRTATPVAWYVPGHGWTYLSEDEAARRRRIIDETFTRHAKEAQVRRLAAKAPTRWPRKHRLLLDELRRMTVADRRYMWSWNDRNRDVDGLKAGALLLTHDDQPDRVFDTLDDAAAVLCLTTEAPAKRTAKAELVKFLRTVATVLPAEHQAEAHRLLEAA